MGGLVVLLDQANILLIVFLEQLKVENMYCAQQIMELQE